jgi:hypothetical protein
MVEKAELCSTELVEKARQKMAEAKKLLEDAVEHLPEEVENCNTFRLSFWLGDAAMGYGMAATALTLFPQDPALNKMQKDIGELYDKAWRLRDRFMEKCKPPGW